MIRTQVSLDEKEYQLAKKEARLLGISVAEFVRRAVRQALPPVRPAEEAPWMKYAGMVASGDPHSSDFESIDDVVYGTRD